MLLKYTKSRLWPLEYLEVRIRGEGLLPPVILLQGGVELPPGETEQEGEYEEREPGGDEGSEGSR